MSAFLLLLQQSQRRDYLHSCPTVFINAEGGASNCPSPLFVRGHVCPTCMERIGLKIERHKKKDKKVGFGLFNTWPSHKRKSGTTIVVYTGMRKSITMMEEEYLGTLLAQYALRVDPPDGSDPYIIDAVDSCSTGSYMNSPKFRCDTDGKDLVANAEYKSTTGEIVSIVDDMQPGDEILGEYGETYVFSKAIEKAYLADKKKYTREKARVDREYNSNCRRSPRNAARLAAERRGRD